MNNLSVHYVTGIVSYPELFTELEYLRYIWRYSPFTPFGDKKSDTIFRFSAHFNELP